MAWSGSEKFTPKYVQTKPKEENNKSTAEKNSVAKAVSLSNGDSKKNVATSHTQPKSDLKFSGGYQSTFEERKQNGRVFTPSTVLGRNYGAKNGFDLEKPKTASSSTWLDDIIQEQQKEREKLRTWKETKNSATANKTEMIKNAFYNDFMYRKTNGTYETRVLYDNYGSFDNEGLKLVGIGKKKEYSLTDELNNKMLELYNEYRSILDTTSGTTQLNALNKLQADNIDTISEFEKQTNHKFSFMHLGEAYERAVWNGKSNNFWRTLQNYADVRYADDFDYYSQLPTDGNSKLQKAFDSMTVLTEEEAKNVRELEEQHVPAHLRRTTEGVRSSKSYIDPDTFEVVEYSLNDNSQWDDNYAYLYDSEKAVYNYLYNKMGSNYADDYLDKMEIVLNKRKALAEAEYNKRIAEENKVESFIKARAANIAGGVLSYADSGVQAVKQAFGIGDYKPYDAYTDANALTHTKQALDAGVTADMGKWGKFAYNVGTGVFDNTARAVLFGKASLPMMGMSVAGETAVNRGVQGEADAGSAFWSGTAAGAIEMAAEALPLHNVLKVMKAPPSTMKEAVVTVLKNVGIEGSEEAFSNVANNIADRIINGDTSEYERYRQSLIAKGATEEEATKKAFTQFYLYDTLEAAAQGTISGLVMNTGSVAAGAYNDTVNTGAEHREGMQGLIDTGMTTHESTKAHKYAERMQNKLDNDRQLSDWNVGRQFQKNVKAIEAEESLRNSISQNLGVDIEIHSYLANRKGQELNGYYDGKDTIDVSQNGTTSIPATFGHEVSHFLKNYAPQVYSKMQKYVIESAQSTDNNGFKDRINYHLNTNRYSYEVAVEEVVAELSENIFGRKNSIDNIVKNNPILAQQFVSSIKSAKARIKDAFMSPNTNRTGLQMTYTQLDNFEQMYNNALREAMGNKGNVSSPDGSVRYSVGGIESNGLKDQIRNNLEELNGMSPVVKYSYDIDMNLTNVEKRNNVMDEYLQKYSLDNKNIIVTRKGWGDVSVGAKEIRSGLRYLNTDAEYAAVLAVPYIITDGIEIGRHNNHKNRGYNTITFAAPVEINGTRGNMAVTIKETNKYKYKMHRILLPDGSMFEFLGNEKNSSYNDGTVDNYVNGSPSITTVSTNTISNPDGNVNTSERYSLAGEHAKTAEFDLLGTAMAMDEQGVDAKTIWKETGWGKGQDGLWRFEIDNSEAEYIGDGSKRTYTLSEILKHDKLYEAYPELKNMQVTETSNMDGGGFYSPVSNSIFLNEEMSNEYKRKVLIHETQHAIQMIEGFAVGETYYGNEENYGRSAGENEANDVKARADMTDAERRNTFPESMKPREGVDVTFWEDHPMYKLIQEQKARNEAAKEKRQQKNVRMDDADGRIRFVPRKPVTQDSNAGRRVFVPRKPVTQDTDTDRVRFVPRLNAVNQQSETDRVRFVPKLGNTEERYSIKESADDSGRRKFVPRVGNIKYINRQSDGEEFEKYKNILGEENVPKTLEEFQEIKYNDSDEWKQLKYNHQTVERYEIEGNTPIEKVIQLDNAAWNTKQNGFDYSNLHGKEREKARQLKNEGNAAVMELDGITYFAYSRADFKGNLEYDLYAGEYPLVGLKSNRRYEVLDLGDGDYRYNDTEAKFFEYVADMKNPNDEFTITILSERHMCKSCRYVMEQFKRDFPKATINIISGRRGYNGDVKGTKTWKNRKE